MAEEANFGTDDRLSGLSNEDLVLIKGAASNQIRSLSRDKGTDDPLIANAHQPRIEEYENLVNRIDSILRLRGIHFEEDFYQ